MVEATAKCTHTHICTQTQLLIWHHPDHTEIYIKEGLFVRKIGIAALFSSVTLRFPPC